jgi:hypothetical protein
MGLKKIQIQNKNKIFKQKNKNKKIEKSPKKSPSRVLNGFLPDALMGG